MMETEVAAIADGRADELVWLLEHPPLYTAGTSADASDLIDPDRFPSLLPGGGENIPITVRASGSPM
jgi:lipoyl(octanoyl) transferase